MKEPEYNENGCVSGGFIFDQMDRYAARLMRAAEPRKHVFTKYANVVFRKQICDWDKMTVNSTVPEKDRINDEYHIRVWVCDKNVLGAFATGEFIFVAKDHACCKGVEK